MCMNTHVQTLKYAFGIFHVRNTNEDGVSFLYKSAYHFLTLFFIQTVNHHIDCKKQTKLKHSI